MLTDSALLPSLGLLPLPLFQNPLHPEKQLPVHHRLMGILRHNPLRLIRMVLGNIIAQLLPLLPLHHVPDIRPVHKDSPHRRPAPPGILITLRLRNPDPVTVLPRAVNPVPVQYPHNLIYAHPVRIQPENPAHYRGRCSVHYKPILIFL